MYDDIKSGDINLSSGKNWKNNTIDELIIKQRNLA
jgi:hypothetical protein